MQHERADADTVQPLGHLLALVIDRQKPVAAARADHHGGAVRLFLGRQVDRKRGPVLLLLSYRSRCALRPEVFDRPHEGRSFLSSAMARPVATRKKNKTAGSNVMETSVYLATRCTMI